VRQYHYSTADVFTTQAFGGNQLGVVHDARGLSTDEMAAIAREFNFSETTFVLPAEEPGNTRRVRIFTPGGELPFAGHPTVGTAHVLAARGLLPLTGDETRIVFEEGVGPVPVTIRSTDGVPTFCQLSVARLPEVGAPLPSREELAAMLALEVEDLLDGAWSPECISCGVPYAIIPLRNRDAVRRAQLVPDVWTRLLAGTTGEMVFVFAREAEEAGHDIRARMFALGVGIAEDPATGSAAATLGGYLATRDARRNGTLRWVMEQGYEMGRPSVLEIEVDKDEGAVRAVRVGGASVLMMEGTLTLP
jgi:trans-2,3-dihydro-3-hydroxyanthranilate isomerase